jgi:hypothetical protein
MKRLSLLICLSLFITGLFAQAPGMFKYQAVVRNNAGEVIKNQNVALKISILQGSASGSIAYSEIHHPQTNEFGLVNLEIGNGSVISGTFSAINWGAGSFFIKIELDPNNGSNFVTMGTSQLLSVPYSLYASKAGNGFSGSYNDLTNKPNFAAIALTGSFNDLLNKPNFVTTASAIQAGDLLYYNGTSWQLLPKGVNGQTLRLDNGLPNWGEPGYALPMVTTNAVTDVLQTGAKCGGNIVATGFSNITAKGVCWSTNQNPTTADSKTNDGSGIGSFNSTITNLISNTTYYMRAYATNSAGNAYGNQVTFKTILNVVFPTVTTTAVTNITANAVTSGGNVTTTGGGEVTERGVCWSDHQNPVITDSKTSDGAGTGQFQSQIAGLVPGTYYARAYATNSAGTGYGNMVTFSTEKTLPVLTTKVISEISAMGGVSGGNITSAGGGTISGRGICWNDSPNPTIDNEKTTSTATASSYSAAIAKATPGTTYYLKAYATNEIGTGYGDQKTFTTSDAQYYTSFENGMTPANWSGPFTVTNENAFEGSYSYKSLIGVTCDAIFNSTLSTSGQISFYYSISGTTGGYTPSIDLYIDDVKIVNLPKDGSGWRQAIANLTSGAHSIKWHLFSPYNDCKCYIDQIIITK